MRFDEKQPADLGRGSASAIQLVLHIRVANDVKRPHWQERARHAEEYISDALGVVHQDPPRHVDRMMQLDRWSGMQRNNPLGNGLRILAIEVLRRWGNPELEYEEEEEESATEWFPRIDLSGRSDHPSIDIGVSRADIPRTIVSCKWSLRHDRVSESTNECTEHRAAVNRLQTGNLRYYVITNELDCAIQRWWSEAPARLDGPDAA